MIQTMLELFNNIWGWYWYLLISESASHVDNNAILWWRNSKKISNYQFYPYLLLKSSNVVQIILFYNIFMQY